MLDFDMLLRYFRGLAGPEEAMYIDEWLGANESNRHFFNELYADWLEAGDQEYKVADIEAAWNRFTAGLSSEKQPPVVRKQTKKQYTWYAVAASLMLLISVGVYTLLHEPAPVVVQNNGAAPMLAVLPDGTKVELYPQAEIRYPKTFTKGRDIDLDGVAFFEVTHDAQQPFTVHVTEQLAVRVLGTSFLIREKSDSTTVEVMTGRVAFYDIKDTVLITPGQTGLFASANSNFTMYRSVYAGSFEFDDIPMKTVIEQLEKHFRVHFHVANSKLYHCWISASFENESLEEIMKVIGATFSIDYKIQDTDIYLSGGACQ